MNLSKEKPCFNIRMQNSLCLCPLHKPFSFSGPHRLLFLGNFVQHHSNIVTVSFLSFLLNLKITFVHMPLIHIKQASKLTNKSSNYRTNNQDTYPEFRGCQLCSTHYWREGSCISFPRAAVALGLVLQRPDFYQLPNSDIWCASCLSTYAGMPK